jgi:hypothetical protein
VTPAARGAAGGALLVALALGACGPYAELAQRLDVTARIAGDTWIAAVGPDRVEVRVLVVGKPDARGAAPFSFTSMPGASAVTLQGTWLEVGSAGDVTLRIAHTYTLPDESARAPLNRAGAQRDDGARTLHVTVARDAGRLVVAGDPLLSGTYVGLAGALGRLGTATERDAACAYQLASLSVESSEARIIGFGGPGMLQYQHPETYVGTVAGTVRVSMSGFLQNTTRIEYGGFSDQGGVVLTGPQVTEADSSGDGHMSGVVTFALTPASLDPSAAGTPITGRIDYGGAGNPGDAVVISRGNPAGGFYVTSIDGGATARVPATAVTAPSPSVADCLGLP